MAFLEELKKSEDIQLRKAETVDKSGPMLSGMMTEAEVKKHHEYLAKFDTESWLTPIEALTFDTSFVDITLDEGKAIHRMCEVVCAHQKAVTLAELSDEHKEVPTLELDFGPPIDALIKRIDATIATMDSATGVFAKMSSRSAKDATDAEDRLRLMYTEAIGKMDDPSDNDRVRVLMEAATLCMKVTDGRGIVNMFAHSERIMNDMDTALKYPLKFSQHVALRKWQQLHIGMEFRGFVCDNVFTALSQYNYFIFFPEVLALKKEIAERITAFWEAQCRERLREFESYVIDFALCGDGFEQIYVIELNPFFSSTDSALFSWKTERAILEKGPFEFRITEAIPTKRPHIDSQYRKLLGWE